MKLVLADEAATQAFAALLAPHLRPIQLITLSGDLGAGKTTLVRALLQVMGHSGRVKSPTFTLVEPYEINNRPVYHFDLYRLAHPDELEYLGFSDYFESEALCLIEWPERAAGALPPANLELTLYHRKSGRELLVSSGTPAGEKIRQLLAESTINSSNRL